MNIIKQYTAILIGTVTVNDSVEVSLSYGNIEGPYYNQLHPEETFDSEEEAIEYAHKANKYARWLIVPIISFEH